LPSPHGFGALRRPLDGFCHDGDLLRRAAGDQNVVALAREATVNGTTDSSLGTYTDHNARRRSHLEIAAVSRRRTAPNREAKPTSWLRPPALDELERTVRSGHMGNAWSA
jgi:hypothetical protein